MNKNIIITILMFICLNSCSNKEHYGIQIETKPINSSKYKGSSVGKHRLDIYNYTFRDVIFFLNKGLDTLAVSGNVKFDRKLYTIKVKSKEEISMETYRDILFELCKYSGVKIKLENRKVKIKELLLVDVEKLDRTSVSLEEEEVKGSVFNMINYRAVFKSYSLGMLSKQLTDILGNHNLFMYYGSDKDKYNLVLPIINYNELLKGLEDVGIKVVDAEDFFDFYILTNE